MLPWAGVETDCGHLGVNSRDDYKDVGMGAFPLCSWLLTASGLLTLLLAGHAAFQPRQLMGRWFALLMLAASCYSLGYALELQAADLAEVKQWLRVQYLGIAFIPALICILALLYTHNFPSRRVLTVLFGLSLTTLVLQVTNDQHGLFYASMSLQPVAGLTITRLVFGPWYYVHILYLNASLLLSTGLFLRSWYRAPPYHRHQALIILAGSLAPWLCYLIYLGGLSPAHIDLSPFGFALTGPLYAIGLFRYRFVDLLPIARERVFDAIDEAVLVMDLDDRLVDFNQAASRIFTMLSASCIGQPYLSVLGPGAQILKRLTERDTPLTVQLGEPLRRFEGSSYPIAPRAHQPLGWALLLRDISERSRLLEELHRLAHQDALTGVANRRQLLLLAEQALERALRDQRPLSLIMLDVDGFKQLNDSQGHLAGDALLLQLSRLIAGRLRQSDVFGRYGGDEFMIFLPETDTDQALQLAGELRQRVEQELVVTLSLGVASRGENTIQLQQLIQQADQALYRAKEAGRNRVGVIPANECRSPV